MFFFLTSTMYRCTIIVFGVLYPAFNSYKSLNRRDGYEQVKWMMYWIVFAAFTACEVVTDLFFSWLPLYYEAKIAFVLWMVLPITRGSSYLYRKIIHPNLLKHETEIDRYIATASNKGCEVLLEFGQHGMNIAANAVLKTADHLKKSYSVGDISTATGTGAAEHSPGTLGRAFSQTNLKFLTASASNDSIPFQEETPGRVTRNSRSSKQGTTSGIRIQQQSNQNASAGQVSRRVKKALHKVDEEC